MKKLIAFVIIVAALGTGGWAYYQNRARPEPTVSTRASHARRRGRAGAGAPARSKR